MAAYLVADVDVADPDGFEEYRKLAIPTLGKYGARLLASGGVEVLEGDWNPRRLALVRFDSAAQVRRWYGSPEYTEAKRLRDKTARTRFIIVEGV